MIPELQAKPSLSIPHQSFPKIDYVFDRAIHVVRRSKELMWESKELVVALLILVLLVKHAWHVLRY